VASQVKTLLDERAGVPPPSMMPAGLAAYRQPDTAPRLTLKA
jgi:hypothetical protein